MSPAGPPPSDESGGKPEGPGASKETPTPETGSPPVEDSSVPSALPAPKRRVRRRARPRGPDRGVQDAWVVRLKGRDETALREVVDAYGERITAVVSGILRDRDAVDDVVQATFTKAWFRIESFKGSSSLYTWLYRVAINASKDYIKGRSRRPAAPLDERQAATIPSSAPHVLEGLERRELRQHVREAIDRLPERYRTVLALRELEGLTYEGIASVLGLSLGTVESRLFRARKRLRALLATETGNDEKGARS